MNKNQKALTLVALAVFVFISLIRSFFITKEGELNLVKVYHFEDRREVQTFGNFTLTLLDDGLSLLTLAVVYTGLFFVLQTKGKS